MKSLVHYTNKRFDRLEKALKQYQRFSEVETLHRLRIEIKKIKVLLLLINYCVRHFKAHKTFIPLRAIFRKAGAIRQPAIFSKLLLRYQIKGVRGEIISPASSSNRPETAFINEIYCYIKTVIQQKELVKKEARNISRTCIRRYVKLRKKALRKELYPVLHPDRLHKSRKTMKEIIYLSRLEKSGRQKLDGFYKDLEVLVGQWHDRQMLTFELIRNKTTEDVNRLTNENESDIRRIAKKVKRYYKQD